MRVARDFLRRRLERDRGIEDSRTVEMQRNLTPMRRRRNLCHVRELDRRAAAPVVSIFDHDERRLCEMIVVARAKLARLLMSSALFVVGVCDDGGYNGSQSGRAASLVQFGLAR